jgi:hypothetical protein
VTPEATPLPPPDPCAGLRTWAELQAAADALTDDEIDGMLGESPRPLADRKDKAKVRGKR